VMGLREEGRRIADGEERVVDGVTVGAVGSVVMDGAVEEVERETGGKGRVADTETEGEMVEAEGI